MPNQTRRRQRIMLQSTLFHRHQHESMTRKHVGQALKPEFPFAILSLRKPLCQLPPGVQPGSSWQRLGGKQGWFERLADRPDLVFASDLPSR